MAFEVLIPVVLLPAEMALVFLRGHEDPRRSDTIPVPVAISASNPTQPSAPQAPVWPKAARAARAMTKVPVAPYSARQQEPALELPFDPPLDEWIPSVPGATRPEGAGL